MEIRIGYVSQSLAIFQNTPSSTFTYKRFKEGTYESSLAKAIEVGRRNLEATRRILYFNAAHGIRLYRLSSSLIPLATHPEVGIVPSAVYERELAELGEFARGHDIRVSMHPNQFTLLNGSDAVVKAAIRDLEYHADILDGMGMGTECNMNIHVGGAYGNKAASAGKLVANLPGVPERVRRRLTLENDDKTYTAEETLAVCEQSGIPMVLDLHHDWCNPSAAAGTELLPRIAATWGERPIKIHVSSPKSDKDFRAHADYAEPEAALGFLQACKAYGLQRVDVMVEAKRKDYACLKLAEDLAAVRGIRRIDGGVLHM
ncbi:UV DNA damage repair endonuclease UvsE [Paenibacillus lutrae]|uniref:UV DNA damage repair endonuclease UvsE n=1 Tax=Paenibacillus lutrae TaxID=2078573 RepID=A0A7X3FL19_9BACL|nr:UV DNA damage repair endonuclease UvsE [Paenibacillus lutrae]MVP01696.1 UV DNA damage repair endonuclease UvsE [Paenibacillus lutrae]